MRALDFVLTFVWLFLAVAYFVSDEPADPIFTGVLCLLLAIHAGIRAIEG